MATKTLKIAGAIATSYAGRMSPSATIRYNKLSTDKQHDSLIYHELNGMYRNIYAMYNYFMAGDFSDNETYEFMVRESYRTTTYFIQRYNALIIPNIVADEMYAMAMFVYNNVFDMND